MSDLFTILIDRQEFKYWSSIRFDFEIDQFDRFEFDAPFDPLKSALRDVFTPLSFKPIEILLDDDPFLTGILLNVLPKMEDQTTVVCSGYASPGVINDVSIPLDKYPLEFNDQTLRQIAEKIAGFFDLSVSFSDLPGAAFDRVALETGKNPLSFLIDLAKKRSFLIGNDALGNLLFRRAITTGSQTNLREGHTPLQAIDPEFDPQKFFSSVTGILPGQPGADSEAVTIKNPFLSNIDRHYVYKENQDLKSSDFKKAVEWKTGLMFANAVRYSIGVQGLRNEFGNIWKPNQLLNVYAPKAMIYKETTLLIKGVNLNRSDGDTASLTAVLPESFAGTIPKTLPWII